MFKSLFKSCPKNRAKKEHKQEKTSSTLLSTLFIEGESPKVTITDDNKEFQLPPLHRAEIHMTAELVRRMEEEKLRERYHLSSIKEGMYL